MKELVLAIPSIFFIGLSNSLLKLRISYLNKEGLNIFSNQFLKFLFDPYIFVGAFAMLCSIIWYLKIIPSVRLGVIYPIIHGGTILFTLFLSIFLIKESLSTMQIFAILFIVIGLVLLIK